MEGSDFLKNKAVNIILFTVVISICTLALVLKSNQTAYDYLCKNAGKELPFAVNEFLYQTSIGSNECIIFYINGKGNVNCAIIKKTIIFYKILEISSELPLLNNDRNADYIFSTYSNKEGFWNFRRDNDNKYKWIDWGIIRDENVKQVLVNDKEANLVDIDLYGVRIYYILGDLYDESEITHELIY